jgi:hypothetical protein
MMLKNQRFLASNLKVDALLFTTFSFQVDEEIFTHPHIPQPM